MNGRRTPDANQLLKGAHHRAHPGERRAENIPRARGIDRVRRKAIAERFRREGVPIRGVIALGGVAKKSPFIMQIVADVMDVPIRVPRAEQTCALGAAMFAAAAAGSTRGSTDSMKAMASPWKREYTPRPGVRPHLCRPVRPLLRAGGFVEQETLQSGAHGEQ